jgi:hypothetical protein
VKFAFVLIIFVFESRNRVLRFYAAFRWQFGTVVLDGHDAAVRAD